MFLTWEGVNLFKNVTPDFEYQTAYEVCPFADYNDGPSLLLMQFAVYLSVLNLMAHSSVTLVANKFLYFIIEVHTYSFLSKIQSVRI